MCESRPHSRSAPNDADESFAGQSRSGATQCIKGILCFTRKTRNARISHLSSASRLGNLEVQDRALPICQLRTITDTCNPAAVRGHAVLARLGGNPKKSLRSGGSDRAGHTAFGAARNDWVRVSTGPTILLRLQRWLRYSSAESHRACRGRPPSITPTLIALCRLVQRLAVSLCSYWSCVRT